MNQFEPLSILTSQLMSILIPTLIITYTIVGLRCIPYGWKLNDWMIFVILPMYWIGQNLTNNDSIFFVITGGMFYSMILGLWVGYLARKGWDRFCYGRYM